MFCVRRSKTIAMDFRVKMVGDDVQRQIAGISIEKANIGRGAEFLDSRLHDASSL